MLRKPFYKNIEIYLPSSAPRRKKLGNLPFRSLRPRFCRKGFEATTLRTPCVSSLGISILTRTTAYLHSLLFYTQHDIWTTWIKYCKLFQDDQFLRTMAVSTVYLVLTEINGRIAKQAAFLRLHSLIETNRWKGALLLKQENKQCVLRVFNMCRTVLVVWTKLIIIYTFIMFRSTPYHLYKKHTHIYTFSKTIQCTLFCVLTSDNNRDTHMINI